MTASAVLPLGVLALVVVVPLAREYAALRRDWGLGRGAALGTAGTLVPSLALGLALSHPLADRPLLQWLATVAATFAAYSLATALLRPSLTPQRATPPRSR